MALELRTTPDGALRGKRIAIVEDHGLIALVLRMELAERGAHAERVELTADALRRLPQRRPDLAVVDVELGAGLPSGVDLLPGLRACGADVLVLTGVTDPIVHARCVEAGAAAIVLKTEAVDAILDQLERVAHGECVLPPAHAASLLDALTAHRQRDRRRLAPFHSLTSRESEVVALMTEGLSAAEMAAELYLSITTVRGHIRSVLTKLGVTSQLAAAAMARRAGYSIESRYG